MSLSKEDVEKIAQLARISLDEQDITNYARDLSNILDLVEQMNSIDTSTILPMAHPLDATARLRPDVISETDQHEHFQSIAPQTEGGLYLVPKVIE